ncbi:hypothetical protein QUF49_12955 [Fictibacillus sp. b24]|nr:hypothetical protein [Fictibacillus sp. b24]MDM5316909.1 hypothetical protein [Fictibacillus sp. b24]
MECKVARLLRDRRAGETLKSETYECGSPPAPRKASNLERRSTTFYHTNA